MIHPRSCFTDSLTVSVFLMLAIIFVGTPSKVLAAQAANFGQLIAIHSGKCLDVPNGGTDDNLGINQHSCDNSYEQSFSLNPIGGNYYNIVARHSGKCIDVPGGSFDDDVQVQQFRCDGSNEQKFAVRMVAGNYFNLVAAHSGKCLDVPNGSVGDNVPINQHSCDGSPEQQFQHYAIRAAAPAPPVQARANPAPVYQQPPAQTPGYQQPQVPAPTYTPAPAPQVPVYQPPQAQAPASPNARFLNEWAAVTRDNIPSRVDIFEITNVLSRCPSGCEHNFPDTYLAIEATMPDYSKSTMPFQQLVARIKSIFADEYCKSEGKDRGVIIRLIVNDMYGDRAANAPVEPSDCVANSTQHTTTNTTSGLSGGAQPPQFTNYIAQFRPVAQYPLASDAQDSSGNSSAMSLAGVQFNNGALYSAGMYDQNTASAYPNHWDLNTFVISARFYVNDMEKDRPVFITGQRWLGFYLNQNGTVSMSYNNSNMVQGNQRYRVNTWHQATIAYQNGVANFYLDGVHAGGQRINFDFVNQNPRPSVGITDYSNGATFKGWIKDLTVSILR